MKSFYQELNRGLVFLPELGIGRYPVPAARPYDESYFAKYQQLADTETGRALTQARIQLVERHYTGLVLDVGIGAGQFVDSRPETQGFDVNPAGVDWLNARGAYADLYANKWRALTMWDVLEHIDEPELAVQQATEFVFVSIPIFTDAGDILRSHHFRKNEHIWYFTDDGIKRWFADQGFGCVEQNTIECQLGRKGVASYAFQRI
ncbi:methyltransferase domain-containing protein [Serratia liquefaciens]|uniref:methyltransferase domain-containing protein n=1 Tax=Serratia liquefaciens TaxID=614 RepID=UPI003906CFB8